SAVNWQRSVLMNIKGSAWLIPPLMLIPQSSHWGLLAWSIVAPFVLPGFSTRPETSRVIVLAGFVCSLDTAGVITEKGASVEEMPP
ncbi:mCG144499, partial [Mus musculus]